MHKSSLFTLAALSAACLLPTGAWAQNDATTTTTTETVETNSVMDVGQFRDSLHQLHDLFTQMRENRNLALTAQDAMISSKYEAENRRLLVKALGVTDSVTRNWKRADIPSMPNETAEMRNSHERLGTADAERFATESEDTAFVRNTMWDIQNSLNAAKLNGRDPIINDKMMSMLDAAIARAENPSFRVAWHAMNKDLLSRNIEFSRNDTVIPPAPKTVEETTTVESAPAPAPTTEETTTEKTQVEETPAPTPAPAPEETTTEETTTTERAGAANLPQTGGDPGMLVLFGSSLMGLGAVLRRRK